MLLKHQEHSHRIINIPHGPTFFHGIPYESQVIIQVTGVC